MAPSKFRFIVKSRLELNKPFIQLEVNSAFDNLPKAEERMQEWLRSVADLLKSKPEAIIETEEFQHLADCGECGTPLFRDDVVFHTQDAKYCYDCTPFSGEGYFDLL